MDVTIEDLTNIIGRLTVEVEVLRAQKAQLIFERDKNGNKAKAKKGKAPETATASIGAD